jgi:hypothetical protein
MFDGLAQYHGAAPVRNTPPPPAEDDEWSFASALPPGSESALAQNELIVTDTNLRIVLDASRPAMTPDGPILLKVKFSNNASAPIHDLTFQMAVTKVRPSVLSTSLSSLLFRLDSYVNRLIKCEWNRKQADRYNRTRKMASRNL